MFHSALQNFLYDWVTRHTSQLQIQDTSFRNYMNIRKRMRMQLKIWKWMFPILNSTRSQWVLNLSYFHLKIGFSFFEEPFYFKFTCLISSGESASNPGPESDCESTMSRDESPRLHSSRTGFGIPAATQVNVFSVLTVTLVRQYKFTNMNCKNVLCR
jgi:hypothetical protein